MQISRSVHPEVSTEDTIQGDSQVSRGSIPRFSPTKGEPDRRRTYAGGSCSHAGKHSSEVCGKLSDRGYIKGKSAIHIAREYRGKKKNYGGEHFWARGFFVSTVGKDEKAIREYIRKQEDADRRMDQMTIFE